MEGADLEAAAERPITAAQEAVFGQVPAQPRHLVASVVEQHEQAAVRAQDTRGLGQLSGGRATERVPQADDEVGARIGRIDPPGRAALAEAGHPSSAS